MHGESNLSKEIVIKCCDVNKTYKSDRGSAKIIENLSLNVYRNEFLVLFGPGQCGKTTLINILSGLIPATSGSIFMGEESVTGPNPKRGVVYQSISLFPWLTVKGNVEYGPKVQNISKKIYEERAQHYINLVGLGGFENSYPIQLSGGMKQRVGIARAYCNNPEILFMDEPFGALDAQTRYLMQKEIERIWSMEKKTIIFVTNNIEEAVYLADRIVVLKETPTNIKKEYLIDLPRPRNYTNSDFIELRKNISSIAYKYE